MIKDTCCGCTACKNICPTNAISMSYNKEGFLYPNRNLSLCCDCNMCHVICNDYPPPQITKEKQHIYATRLNDLEKLAESQSGGAFTAIAESFLVKTLGSVYGVALVDNKAKYIRVTDINQLKPLKGSKYLQAELDTVFTDIQQELINGSHVLFSGTACHIHGLLRYIDKMKINTENLCTIDNICFGTASPLIFSEYIDFLSREYKGNISEFVFRDKSLGWHNNKSSFKSCGEIHHTDSYTILYYSRLAHRPCCYSCPYTSFNRISDITLGDFWGIEKLCSDFKDGLGVSIVIINTDKGAIYFEKAKNNMKIIESNRYYGEQPRLEYPTPKPPNRDKFWKLYQEKGFFSAYKKYVVKRFRRKIRTFLKFILSK